MPLSEVETLQQALDSMLLARRGITTLSAAFAGLALLLSVIGIYAVLSFEVQQRRREIGIRAAIGASRGAILAMILKQGLGKTLLGLAIGLLGSFYLTRFLEARLFDISSLDALTYFVVTGFLLLVAFVASFLPALRAVRINPVEALKTE